MKKLLSFFLAAAITFSLIPTAMALEYSLIIPPKYDRVEDFSEGMAAVWLDGKCGFVDKTGNEVIPLTRDYEDVVIFHEGMARIKRNGKYGFIDKTGKEVISTKYDNAYSFKEGLAWVKYKDKWGCVDKTGKEVIKPKYPEYIYGQASETVIPFSEGLARVHKFEGYVYIDKTGKEVISISDTFDPGNFNEGLAAIMIDWGMAFIDKTGKVVIPRTGGGYTSGGVSYKSLPVGNAIKFSEGLAAVPIGDSGYGYIDKTGAVVIPGKYKSAQDFHEGLAVVSAYNERMDIKHGIIDKTGAEVVPLGKYNIINNFSDGMARVISLENKYEGFVDKSGKELVLSRSYSNVWDFRDGMAMVSNNSNRRGFIDKTGKEVIPPVFDSAWNFSEGMAMVQLGNKWGFVTVTGTASTVPINVLANPTASNVLVNGAAVAFDAYTINGNNYFKLRDIAHVLNSTGKQFEVKWDGAKNAILLTAGNPYTTVGGEMQNTGTGTRIASKSTSKVLLDGNEITLTAYTIAGNNYFKLRDFGQAFNFGVAWDGAQNTISIDTAIGYTE